MGETVTGQGVLVDSHAHLTMFEPGEVPGVLERARDAGVTGVVVPATGEDDLDLALELGTRYPGTIAVALGVHPHEASTLDSGLKVRLRGLSGSPGVVAVGEVGLDYHYMSSPKEDQIRALEWQLDLALDLGLPVILHNRESWADLEPMLARRRGALRGVCHSFTEGAEAARRVVELGLKVGVSGMVTLKRADNIREIVRALDLADLLVEADSPYLAPVPHRGRRNEPAYVVHTAGRVAEELGCSVEEVGAATTRTVRALFGLGPA